LGSNFGEQFWTAFQTSWQLRAATTLGSSFSATLGQQLWGNSFGEQLWAQLCGAAQGNSFGEQL